MKKRLITAVIALAVFGCQKESATNRATPATNPDQALIDQVDVLTDRFIAQVEPASPQEKLGYSGPVTRVLNEDGRGFTEGSAGGSFWDGIVNGASCSWQQFKKEVSNALPAPGPITANPDNAYDFTGQEHYALMASMLEDPSTVEVDGVFDYDLYHNYAVATLAARHPEINEYVLLPPAWLRERAEANDPRRSAAEFVHGLELSPTERQILIFYMTAFEDVNTNAAQFIAYSINVENAITAANLPEIQKARLLGTMSTYRCGTGFYAIP